MNGVVYRAALRGSKTVDNSNEAKVLQVLSEHGDPYILQIFAGLRMGGQDYLVTEIVSGGELEEFICPRLEEVHLHSACASACVRESH